jgi:hypothetical protein
MENKDVYSGISPEHKCTKNLMITKFPNTISSGKILYRYLFFSYPFLPGHLSLCTDTHFHTLCVSLCACAFYQINEWERSLLEIFGIPGRLLTLSR